MNNTRTKGRETEKQLKSPSSLIEATSWLHHLPFPRMMRQSMHALKAEMTMNNRKHSSNRNQTTKSTNRLMFYFSGKMN